jgi:hypothetical protein
MTPFRRGNSLRFAITAAAAVFLVSALAGCSVSPMPSDSPSSSPTVTQMTDAQALVEFTSIVDASIAKQNLSGITQKTVNSMTGTYLLVADKAGSKYQATEKNPNGSLQLLFEADAFVPSAAKSWLQLGATVSYVHGEYHLTRVIEGTPATYVYIVSGGLLQSKSEQNAEATSVSELTYQVTPEGLDVLKAGEALPKP